MQVTVDELLAIIGAKEVELSGLRKQLAFVVTERDAAIEEAREVDAELARVLSRHADEKPEPGSTG